MGSCRSRDFYFGGCWCSDSGSGVRMVRWTLDIERLVQTGTADSGRHAGRKMFELHEEGQFYKLVYVCCKKDSSGNWFYSIFKTEAEAKNSAEEIMGVFNMDGF